MSTVQSGSTLGLHRTRPSFRPGAAQPDGAPLLPKSPVLAIEDGSSGQGFIAMLSAFRASGGTAPGSIVCHLLDDRPDGDASSLAQLVHSDQVFGFPWRGSLWIPMFQFNAGDLSIKTGPQQVRAALPSLPSGWGVAAWFASPNATLHGQRPVDLVDVNLDAVMHAARSWPGLASQAHRMGLPARHDSL